MKKLTFLFIAILSLSAFTSCSKLGKVFIHSVIEAEDLDGVAPEDTVTILEKIAIDSTFSHIKTAGSYDVVLVQGDSIALEFNGRKVYNDNATIRVSGDTLYISGKEDRFSRGKYTITLPTISSLSAEGSTQVSTENFQQNDNFDLVTAGASDIKLKTSSFGDLNINVSGAGDILVKSVLMHNSKFIVSGAGDLNAEQITADTINVEVNGAGNVVASGNCKDYICNINGAGDINIDKLNVANKKANKVNNAIN